MTTSSVTRWRLAMLPPAQSERSPFQPILIYVMQAVLFALVGTAFLMHWGSRSGSTASVHQPMSVNEPSAHQVR